MNYLQNTNDKDCDKGLLETGDCCCNCIFQVRVAHDKVGFVGYLCKLKFPDGSNLYHISFNPHSMCEMHSRVKLNTVLNDK